MRIDDVLQRIQGEFVEMPGLCLTAAQIRTMVLKDGYRPVLEGLGIGLFIGFIGRALLRTFLWERIEIIDPWMVLAVPIPLILAAFFACFWPAHRASRVEPMVALRHL